MCHYNHNYYSENTCKAFSACSSRSTNNTTISNYLFTKNERIKSNNNGKGIMLRRHHPNRCVSFGEQQSDNTTSSGAELSQSYHKEKKNISVMNWKTDWDKNFHRYHDGKGRKQLDLIFVDEVDPNVQRHMTFPPISSLRQRTEKEVWDIKMKREKTNCNYWSSYYIGTTQNVISKREKEAGDFYSHKMMQLVNREINYDRRFEKQNMSRIDGTNKENFDTPDVSSIAKNNNDEDVRLEQGYTPSRRDTNLDLEDRPQSPPTSVVMNDGEQQQQFDIEFSPSFIEEQQKIMEQFEIMHDIETKRAEF